MPRTQAKIRFEFPPVAAANTAPPFATRSKRAPGLGTRAVAVFAKQLHLAPATITLHG
jgi:hypothetical protein